VRIEQLALLLAVVVAANVVLLIALELPRLGRRRADDAEATDAPDGRTAGASRHIVKAAST